MNLFERTLVLKKIEGLTDGQRREALSALLKAMPDMWLLDLQQALEAEGERRSCLQR